MSVLQRKDWTKDHSYKTDPRSRKENLRKNVRKIGSLDEDSFRNHIQGQDRQLFDCTQPPQSIFASPMNRSCGILLIKPCNTNSHISRVISKKNWAQTERVDTPPKPSNVSINSFQRTEK